ncbi:MAG: hypothetical protein CO133_01660, partial [Candidatus Komeilibacteria bacterium CG_4_9_14_3_um_filter_37_5]
MFDRKINIYICVALTLFFLSLFTYLYLPAQAVIWWLIFVLTLVIACRNVTNGLLIMFAELFIGAQGHLFNWHLYGYDISLRIGIFIAVFIGFMVAIVKFKGQKWQQPYIYYLFLGSLLIAIVKGLYFNSSAVTFFDFNNYLFLLILPVVNYIYDRSFLQNVAKLMIAAVHVLALEALLLFYAFAHQLSWLDLGLLYKWVRDLRLYEITHVVENYYRIFSPSQIYSVVVLILLTIMLIYWQRRELVIKNNIYFWLSFFSAFVLLVISFSRSNWLAAIIVLPFMLFVFYYQKLLSWQQSIKVILIIGSSLALAILFIFICSGSWQGNVLQNRIDNLTEEAASSRLA